MKFHPVTVLRQNAGFLFLLVVSSVGLGYYLIRYLPERTAEINGRYFRVLQTTGKRATRAFDALALEQKIKEDAIRQALEQQKSKGDSLRQALALEQQKIKEDAIWKSVTRRQVFAKFFVLALAKKQADWSVEYQDSPPNFFLRKLGNRHNENREKLPVWLADGFQGGRTDNVTLAGTDYQIFTLTASIKGAGAGDDERTVLMCGAVSGTEYERERHSLPTGWLPWVLGLIVLGALSLPFLKLLLMSAREQLDRLDVIGCALSLVIVTGIFLVNVQTSRLHSGRLDSQLRNLGVQSLAFLQENPREVKCDNICQLASKPNPAGPAPTLPPGFGFCVISDKGELLYHSVPDLFTSENVLEDCGYDQKLGSAIKARIITNVDVVYQNEQHRFRIQPLSEELTSKLCSQCRVKGAFLVAYYEYRYDKTRQFQTWSSTTLMLGCFWGLGLLFAMAHSLLKNRINRWPHFRDSFADFWPSKVRAWQYSLVVVALGVTLVVLIPAPIVLWPLAQFYLLLVSVVQLFLLTYYFTRHHYWEPVPGSVIYWLVCGSLALFTGGYWYLMRNSAPWYQGPAWLAAFEAAQTVLTVWRVHSKKGWHRWQLAFAAGATLGAVIGTFVLHRADPYADTWLLLAERTGLSVLYWFLWHSKDSLWGLWSGQNSSTVEADSGWVRWAITEIKKAALWVWAWLKWGCLILWVSLGWCGSWAPWLIATPPLACGLIWWLWWIWQRFRRWWAVLPTHIKSWQAYRLVVLLWVLLLGAVPAWISYKSAYLAELVCQIRQAHIWLQQHPSPHRHPNATFFFETRTLDTRKLDTAKVIAKIDKDTTQQLAKLDLIPFESDKKKEARSDFHKLVADKKKEKRQNLSAADDYRRDRITRHPALLEGNAAFLRFFHVEEADTLLLSAQIALADPELRITEHKPVNRLDMLSISYEHTRALDTARTWGVTFSPTHLDRAVWSETFDAAGVVQPAILFSQAQVRSDWRQSLWEAVKLLIISGVGASFLGLLIGYTMRRVCQQAENPPFNPKDELLSLPVPARVIHRYWRLPADGGLSDVPDWVRLLLLPVHPPKQDLWANKIVFDCRKLFAEVTAVAHDIPAAADEPARHLLHRAQRRISKMLRSLRDEAPEAGPLPLIVLTYFEFQASNPDVTDLKRQLVESLLLTGQPILILSSIHPKGLAEHAAQLKPGKEKGASLHAQRSRPDGRCILDAIGDFWMQYFSLDWYHAESSILRLVRHPPTPYYRYWSKAWYSSYDRLRPFLALRPYPLLKRALGVPDYNGIQQALGLNRVIESRKRTLLEIECDAFPFVSAMRADILGALWRQRREVEHQPRTYEPVTREELADVVRRCAWLHYRRIWLALSAHEKFLLHDLAADSLVNTQIRRSLHGLTHKGLLQFDHNGRLHVASEAFRQYIIAEPRRPEALSYAREAPDDYWGSIQLPLVLLLTTTGLFLALTQPGDLFQPQRVLALLSGIVPLLTYLFGTTSPTSAVSNSSSD